MVEIQCTMILVSIPMMHALTTYHSLHHFHSLLPDLVDHLRYVDRVLYFYLLQNMVNGNEDGSTTNSSTEGKCWRGEYDTVPQTLSLTCSGPPWGL